jgi:hypothetical protein
MKPLKIFEAFNVARLVVDRRRKRGPRGLVEGIITGVLGG